MSYTATRSAGVLFVLAPTEFLPSYFSFDQCLQPLTYLMIVVHVIVFVKAFQKLIHALTLRTIDRVEWSDTSPTVKRNCPGSRIRRRRSTTPTNGDPVVPLGRCSRCNPQTLSCRVNSVIDHKVPYRKSEVSG